MGLAAGSSTGKLGAGGLHPLHEAADQILGQKRRVGGEADDECAIGPVGGGPIEPGEQYLRRVVEEEEEQAAAAPVAPSAAIAPIIRST